MQQLKIMTQEEDKDVVLAICLTLGAGLATTIGAVSSFCIPLTFNNVLPISLSFSAGVMIYVSFVEILSEALESFETVLLKQNKTNHEFLSHLYLSLSFFGGIFIGFGIDFIVHQLGYHHNNININRNHFKLNKKKQYQTNTSNDKNVNNDQNDNENINYINKNKTSNINDNEKDTTHMREESLETVTVTAIDTTTVALETTQLKSDFQHKNIDNDNDNGIDHENDVQPHANDSDRAQNKPYINSNSLVSSNHSDLVCLQSRTVSCNSIVSPMNTDGSSVALKKHGQIENGNTSQIKEKQSGKKKTSLGENEHLMKMSIITALAIALHNFPEGLATFAATLVDARLGVSIAVAVAIHNIPEGISVSMPVYFATKSKMKGFFWAFLSGVAEPIGGFIGYLIIDSMFGDFVFGWLFGITGGIMIYISFHQLLPTARNKDIDNKYVTILLFIGFFVMDLSLLLFEL